MNGWNRTRLVAAVLVLGGTAGLVAKGKPGGLVPVTTAVHNTDANGATLHIQSDDLTTTGPGHATYQTDSTGVLSDIEATGQSDWVLDLRSDTSNRRVYLALETTAGDPISGLPAGPTPYPARLLSRCFNPAGGASSTVSWFSNTGVNLNCSLRVGFAYESTNYALVMSPAAPYAGTGLVEVQCHGINGAGACVDWTVQPDQNATFAGVAKLFSIDRRGNETYVATARLSFRFRVTYP